MATSSQNSIRIVKLGGSLLDGFDSSDTRASCLYPNEAVRAETTPLRSRLQRWISLQEPMRTFWIVGGGERVEQLRVASQNRDHDPEQLHWHCIDQMNSNSILLKGWFPKWHWIDELSKIPTDSAESDSNNFIFLTKNWLNSNPDLTPHSWEVTSDSIAATLAAEISADELVLLKSCPPTASTVSELSTANYVDKHFSIAISACKPGLNCRFVNFRDLEFPESSMIASPVSRDN